MAQHSEAISAETSDPMEYSGGAVARRPGMVTFAAVIIFAGLGAIRWLFVIPAAPILSVVVIALCVMVIYGIAKYSEQLEST